MKFLYQLAQGFFFCWLLLPLPSLGAPVNQITASDYLVTFSPEIILDSGERCQGVRLSDEYIATSSDCSEQIRSELTRKDIEVINEPYSSTIGDTLEVSDETDAYYGVRISMLYVEGKTNSEYPGIREFSSQVTNAYSYTVDKKGNLVKIPTLLLSGRSQPVYYLPNAESYSSGKPIFDTENNIVCIVSTEGQCTPLPQAYRSERSVKTDPTDTTESNSLSSATPYLIIGGVLFGAGVLSNLMCLGGLHVKACVKGMPLGHLWAALLTFSYCKDPHTDYCLLCGWPGVACSWVGAYQGPPSESNRPLFTNMRINDESEPHQD